MKTSQDAGELDKMEGDVDPLAEMRKHYIPNQSVPSALTEPAAAEAYDPRHIESMEADYEGQHSSQKERHRGQYSGPQLYHIVPSPPRVGVEEEEQLAGPTAEADASPSTEAWLLAESPQPGIPQAKATQLLRPSMPVPPGGLSTDVQGAKDIDTTDV